MNTTLYERMGGADAIRRLVEAFYPRVIQDPDLRDLFPDDIAPVQERQYLFLTQFFGGPLLYSEKHGHPMLRARHMHFPIGKRQAVAWLRCMAEAMLEAGIPADVRDEAFGRLAFTAQHMINQPEDA
jgi:hemoglobin